MFSRVAAEINTTAEEVPPPTTWQCCVEAPSRCDVGSEWWILFPFGWLRLPDNRCRWVIHHCALFVEADIQVEMAATMTPIVVAALGRERAEIMARQVATSSFSG